MTERWADLVAILTREAEIGAGSPDEILEFEVPARRRSIRPASTTSRRRSRRTREVLAARARSTCRRARPSRGSSPPASTRSRSARSSSRSTSRRVSGRSSPPCSRPSSLTSPSREARLAMYYRHRGAPGGAPRLAGRRPRNVFLRAHQGVPGRREDARGGRAARRLRRRRLGDARQRVRRRARHPPATRPSRPSIGKRLARVFEDGARRRRRRPRRRTGTCSASSRSRPRRSPTSIASTRSSSSTRSSPSMLEQRVRAPTEDRSSSSSSTAASGRSYEERLGQLDDAIRAFRRIFDELETTNEQRHQRPRAHLHGQGGLDPAQGRAASASSRTRSGDTPEADIRAKMAHLLADRLERHPGLASRRGSASSSCAARIRRRSGALANLYERVGQWAELCDVLERHYDIAPDDRVARRHPPPPRQAVPRAARPRRLGARRLQPRPRHRLREPRGALRDRGDLAAAATSPNELVSSLHQTRRSGLRRCCRPRT